MGLRPYSSFDGDRKRESQTIKTMKGSEEESAYIFVAVLNSLWKKITIKGIVEDIILKKCLFRKFSDTCCRKKKPRKLVWISSFDIPIRILHSFMTELVKSTRLLVCRKLVFRRASNGRSNFQTTFLSKEPICVYFPIQVTL